MSFCPKCGAQNADDVSFCTNCGAPMTVSQQPQQPQQQPQQPVYYAQPQPQPVYYAQPATPPKKEVSKGKRIASLILSIFSFILALTALGTSFIPFYGLASGLTCAIIALIMGIVSCALYKRGLGVAGIVISAISIFVAIGMFIMYTLILGASAAAANNGDLSGLLNDLINSIK